jgi:predicted  nucleic acid-binding Zn-ribbon protein
MTKTKKDGAQPANGAAPADATPESLDKVRDILFGGQMRAVESRLQGLESRLLRGQEALRSDFAKQLGALDATLQREVQSLGERLAAERAKRTEELKALAAELKEALRGLEKRHQRLEETSGMADADLREGILQHSKAVTADIARLAERLTGELNRSVQELKVEKLNIASLAGLFGDMASKLGADAKGSGKSASRA